MNIIYHRQAQRYLVSYTEIAIPTWLHDLVEADYDVRFSGEVFFGARYGGITVETNTVGAAFLVTSDQVLVRPFTTLALMAVHGLDCLPWYRVQGRAWPIDVTPEDGDPRAKIVIPSKRWSGLETATTLRGWQ